MSGENDMRPRDREAFRAARSLLDDLGVPLVAAVDEYVQCRRKLGEVPLMVSAVEHLRRTPGGYDKGISTFVTAHVCGSSRAGSFLGGGRMNVREHPMILPAHPGRWPDNIRHLFRRESRKGPDACNRLTAQGDEELKAGLEAGRWGMVPQVRQQLRKQHNTQIAAGAVYGHLGKFGAQLKVRRKAHVKQEPDGVEAFKATPSRPCCHRTCAPPACSLPAL
jgi:hypothetical protein